MLKLMLILGALAGGAMIGVGAIAPGAFAYAEAPARPAPANAVRRTELKLDFVLVGHWGGLSFKISL